MSRKYVIENLGQYVLMHEDVPVAELDYDLDAHIARKARVISPEHAPLGTLDRHGAMTVDALNKWWHHRAIPASRAQIERVLEKLDLRTTVALAERNFGLSLSDRYWVNDAANPRRWDEINFFDNEFTEDLGLLLMELESAPDISLFSPDATTAGVLKKKWTVSDGVRYLVKSSTGNVGQEPFNEAIATALYRRLLPQEDFVSYKLEVTPKGAQSICANMLSGHEELIPAHDVVLSRRQPNHIGDYEHLVQCYEALGVPHVRRQLSKMIFCDFLLANDDRHRFNFGIIRDARSLGSARVAPIYDSGSCLWHAAYSLAAPGAYDYVAKPFGINGMKPERQLELATDLGWLDLAALEGFDEEVRDILSRNPNMRSERIDGILKGVERQRFVAARYAARVGREKSAPGATLSDPRPGKPAPSTPAKAPSPASDAKAFGAAARARGGAASAPGGRSKGASL